MESPPPLVEQVTELLPDTAVVEIDYTQNKAAIDAAIEYAAPLLLDKPTIVVYNREVHQQRRVGFFGVPGIEGYKYSGKTMASQPLGALQPLLDIVNNDFAGDAAEEEYNGILVNEYPADGKSCIGEHSDSEAGLHPSGNVIAITVNKSRPRKFNVREKTKSGKGGRLWSFYPKSYSVLIMRGKNFQKLLKHGIPVQKKADYRISFTFRRHKVEKN